MPTPDDWPAGHTVVERFLRPDSSVGRLHPLRVISDNGGVLLGWMPAGTPITSSKLADGRSLREAPLEQRFRLPRYSRLDVWRGTSTLRRIPDDEWSSVWWFFAETGEFTGWYVNLEVPLGRTASGPDRVDGVLDVAIAPDRTWRWKDEDEAEAAVAAGRLTAKWLVRLRQEGERLIELAEAGRFPFDGSWTDFRPDPAWPVPELPESAVDEPGQQAEADGGGRRADHGAG
ncbi:DUF402 domain-containing protein [Amycolatopsis suaedae]|uniref:DUF402 domain-containing protein n=1 Tax=Amycolatopsis suaedae TaxID=2510978 RepID=A0A4Q7IZB4_9PSEU|nr:DUF402 domain-containing protein [Amycolatopsis suaedae]RZQ59423.1 DUF402 domain-containing protein [Amycolatopsis suaedae]